MSGIIKTEFLPNNWWGLECGDGWDLIIANLQDDVEAVVRSNRQMFPNSAFKFAQIKEKFGTLRIYYDLFGEWDDVHVKSIINFVKEAENLSAMTCETCGDEGKTRSLGGWLKTVCNHHYIQWQQRMES